ncbi:restriction endonuclease subunit S [Fusobacterium ulcerans]|uniref:restriction endonuclease subunit S n=1 Tax=Fusobacterium ulcerans TaxID=861 RepID=UPI0026F33FC1|nr:restriction endonuclease subunit S [Fusobacterium ulcerans]
MKLGKVNNVITGNTPSKINKEYWENKDIFFVKPSDLHQKRNLKSSEECIDKRARNNVRILPKYSTLLCCIGSIGKVAYSEVEVCTNQQINSLVPKKEIIFSPYNYYVANSNFFQLQILNSAVATTIAILNKTNTEKLIFPLPPLEEQKRIVEKLDSMFEKINKAKELIQEVKENIENRKESILNKAFRGELTAEWRKNNQTEDAIELLKSINEEKIKNWEQACIEAERSGKKKPSKPKIEEIENMIVSKEEEPYEIPKNWKWVKLGEVIDIKMGQSPNGETVNNTEGIGLIGGPNDMGNLYPKISRYTTSFTKLSSKDDIILSVRATLGRPIFSDGEYCLGRGVCGISSEIINKIFLRHYFFNITDYLYTIATGTTFVQISKENIINLNFPLPPLKEQEEIVRILDEILEKESKIKELIELEEAIELLEKSILDKAFRGELGTRNKEDETAIELLKKIL